MSKTNSENDNIKTPRPHDPGATMRTSETGGHKQAKLARFGLIPPGPLRELAELYGRGAELYSDHNYLKGYDWSLSYDALQRHLNAFWDGEDLDPEARSKHVINAAWHCLALAEFMNHPERYSQFDDRISTSHPQDRS